MLARASARALAPLIRLTGESFERTFACDTGRPSTVSVIEPLVVEVSADAAAQTGVLRHAARLQRVRPDLRLDDLA